MPGALAGCDLPSPILLVLFLCPGGFLLCVYFLFYWIGYGLEGNDHDFEISVPHSASIALLPCVGSTATHWPCCSSYLLVSCMQGKKISSTHAPSPLLFRVRYAFNALRVDSRHARPHFSAEVAQRVPARQRCCYKNQSPCYEWTGWKNERYEHRCYCFF